MPTSTTTNRRTRNQSLGFTVAQQAQYRPLVTSAWQTFCRQTGTDPKDKAARREWYEFHLEAATGKLTTSLCNRTKDFGEAMKEFEAIEGMSIYWATRCGGNADELRRARHGLQEFCREHDVEDHYVIGTARKMYDTADLAGLKPAQVRGILTALKLQLVRSNSLPF